MTRRIAALMALAALGAAAQSGGVVSGRVINSTHGEPVAGATVTLRGLDEGPAQTYIAQTDANGRFSIANVVPGTYEPRPSKSGYEQRTPDHFATAKDFPPVTVEAGKVAAPIELRLIPDGVIAGRVVDNEGDPVPRSIVEAQQYAYVAGKKQLRSIRTVQTDDHGQYRLFHLPPGRYWLHVEPGVMRGMQVAPRLVAQARIAQSGMVALPGGMVPLGTNDEPQTRYAATFYPGSTDVAHATQLQLAPGAEIDGIDIPLSRQRLYSIRGRIALDGPKERFSIYAQSLAPAEGRGGGFQNRIEGDTYEIVGVPPGRYVVIGLQFPDPKLPASQQRQYARQVVEVADRDVEHLDLSFSEGKTIRGVVKTEGTATLKDVLNINVFQEDGGVSMVSQVLDGAFKMDLAPGVYRVLLNGRQLYLKTLRIGDEVVPSKTIDTAHLSGDLTLVISNDFGKVEGTVVDDAGKPVFNADVTLIPDQRQDDWQQRFRSVLSKADGKFSFTAIEPGEYRAYAWLGAEQGAPQDAEFRKPFEDRAVVVKVEANGSQTLQLKAIQAPAQ